jgi:probable rRNA maturation factor
MPSRTPRRRSSGRARLAVTLTAPDGSSLPTRGLVTWLAKAAPATARGEVTVALVSDARMRTLNRAFRNKDYATDVLSFPAVHAGSETATATRTGRARRRADAKRPLGASASANAWADRLAAPGYLGDIVIATGVAQRQADDVGHPVSRELKVLALHGLLHLLGYDHETDEGEMARAEARLQKKAGLKDGLLSRQAR